MAHFYASIRGGRSEGTRTGTKSSGIEGHIRSLHLGVRVKGRHFGSIPGEPDSFQIYMTSGNIGELRDVYLGEVVLDSAGEPVFVPAEKWRKCF